jgi:hypothetical protein
MSISQFLRLGIMDKDINSTHIVLIQKKKKKANCVCS